VRKTIIGNLKTRLQIDSTEESLALQSPDALDAVIAAFGAIAVVKRPAIDTQMYWDGYISVDE